MLIPARLTRFVVPFLMSIYMATIMTFLVTVINTGLADGFVFRWMRAFLFAWPIAFTLLLLGAPTVHRIAAAIVKH
ncbi:DUF2798 domain-containing protein [Salinispirillum sp. LH 10-3-1]|uniref:DUF2798 domain-containing protein n=1 Tax=Salinispirillum sp. LH 10-3-1 TaxID=2952525 RepID=A0AB38YC38_9GAMM